jgi:nucleotide-binding universal stress UspA family protein
VKMEHATVEGAQWREANLIVVGTHGITGFKHAILGSVAEAVVRHSPLPVLSIHGKQAAA